MICFVINDEVYVAFVWISLSIKNDLVPKIVMDMDRNKGKEHIPKILSGKIMKRQFRIIGRSILSLFA